jgi:DNA-binding transcriptional ArsR family regulator
MAALAEQLRSYIVAMAEPTRGAILTELELAGELTPTQIARRLGLTANNVYHHMRVLRRLGVVDPPRAVPRETYVEKYYRVTPELQAAVATDPDWLDRTQATMAPEDRKSLFIGMCLTMAQMLRRAARQYEAMDAEQLDALLVGQQLGMVSINEMGRDQLQRRLKSVRDILHEEYEADRKAGVVKRGPQEDVVLFAGLPFFWAPSHESAQEHDEDPDDGSADDDAD